MLVVLIQIIFDNVNTLLSLFWGPKIFILFRSGDFLLLLLMFLGYGHLHLMSLFKLSMTMWVSCLNFVLSNFILCIFLSVDFYTILILGFKIAQWITCCSSKINNKRHWRCCKDAFYWIRNKSILYSQSWRWTSTNCSRGKLCSMDMFTGIHWHDILSVDA